MTSRLISLMLKRESGRFSSLGSSQARAFTATTIPGGKDTRPPLPEDEREKALRARDLLGAEDLALSVQVLQEFYVQATRPTRAQRLSHEQAAGLVEAFLRFPVQDTTVALVRAALETAARFSVSYWDAAIIEAARALGCATLLTDDLGDGADYGGVRVVNPFTSRPQG